MSKSRKKLEFEEVDDLGQGLRALSFNEYNRGDTGFVAVVPKYVGVSAKDMDEDSSDASIDDTYSESDFEFDKEDLESLPYRTFDIKKSTYYVHKKTVERAQKTPPKKDRYQERQEELPSKKLGILVPNSADAPKDHNAGIASVSEVQKFVELMDRTALKQSDEQLGLLSNIKLSMALNRPKSLSTRKNNVLSKQLNSQEKNDNAVEHKKFGFFWEMPWVNQQGQGVQHEVVRQFYKQLKRYDKEHETKKAIEFLQLNESENSPYVPYQEIRDRAKNHKNTKYLVKKLREQGVKDVYFSSVDGDTLDFNGIYSEYLNVVARSGARKPDIMSTGYEFRDQYSMQLSSELDRNIRILTAQHLPFGVYYPEPNLCVLIRRGRETLTESFVNIARNKEKSDCESVHLLKAIKTARGDVVCLFINGKPLITTVPDRARNTKVSKQPIKFSKEHVDGASPTSDDIRLYKQISQNHYHAKVWLDNLFLHKEIIFKDNAPKTNHQIQHCKSLIADLLAGRDVRKATAELKQYILDALVDKIAKAAAEVASYLSSFVLTHIRSTEEAELLDVLKEHDFDVSDFLSGTRDIDHGLLIELLSDYLDELLELKDQGCTIESIIDLYSKVGKKLKQVAQFVVDNDFLGEDLEELLKVFDESEEFFWDLIEDRESLLSDYYGDDLGELVSRFWEFLQEMDEEENFYHPFHYDTSTYDCLLSEKRHEEEEDRSSLGDSDSSYNSGYDSDY